MKGVAWQCKERWVLWLAKMQEKRQVQKGVTVQVRSDEQRQKNSRFGVETVVFMKERAGRSTAHGKRLWGYCHAQTVWFGIKYRSILRNVGVSKLCWMGREASFLKDMAAEGRHGTIPGNLFETSAA